MFLKIVSFFITFRAIWFANDSETEVWSWRTVAALMKTSEDHPSVLTVSTVKSCRRNKIRTFFEKDFPETRFREDNGSVRIYLQRQISNVDTQSEQMVDLQTSW